jgi:hypothetical protein
MTPEERSLVIELFSRLATLEGADRDPEAERLIEERLRDTPNAPYALVQTVLVQDEALRRADARIRELEDGAAPARDNSFLGSVRESVLGRRETRGSVPSVRPGDAQPSMSPAWQAGGQTPQAGLGPASAVANPGGSFLGTAAAAAAGVIGGSLLLGSIRSMMGQQGSAHAAYDPSAGESGGSPWGGGELSRQAGLDDVGRGSSAAAGDGGQRGFGLLDDGDGGAQSPEADLDDDGFGFDLDTSDDGFDGGDE